MIKLFKNIFSFLLPILIGVIFISPPRELVYNGLNQLCSNHWTWLYKRIYTNDKPVDICFIGSSKTISGIDDRKIESILKDNDRHVLNLACCRLGRDMDYLLLKEVIKNKKPSHIVLEVREGESKFSHPVSPYIRSSTSQLSAYLLFNKNALLNYWIHFYYKVQIIQDWIHGTHLSTTDKTDYGFGSSTDTMEMPSINPVKQIDTTHSWIQSLSHCYPMHYLNKIKRTCAQHKIKLSLLYLPNFGETRYPVMIREYERLGKVYLPPKSIFENPDHWWDENHLNEAGAKLLSEWMAYQLVENH